MPTFREPRFLPDAVESVRRQTLCDWELIVVDDSRNNSVRACLQRWPGDPRIRYFHRQEGRGYADALNFAWDRSRADLIAMLDDDDCWLDERKLEKQVAFLRQHPEIGVCGSSIVRIDADGKEVARFRYPESDAAIRASLLSWCNIASSASLFRRAIGPFDDSVLSADWELWLRAGQGHKLHNLPEFLCACRAWPMNTSKLRSAQQGPEAKQMFARYSFSYPGRRRAMLFYWLFHHTDWLHGFVYRRLPGLRRLARRLLRPAVPGNF